MTESFRPTGWDNTGWQGEGWHAEEADSGSDDSTPDEYELTSQFNVPLSSTRTSNQVRVSGINVAVAVSVGGSTSTVYNINGGSYVSTSGVVVDGDLVTVRHTASGSNSTVVSSSLTIGGIGRTFNSTTVAASTAGGFTPIAAALLNRRRLSL